MMMNIMRQPKAGIMAFNSKTSSCQPARSSGVFCK
jgi:hypothetical protein